MTESKKLQIALGAVRVEFESPEEIPADLLPGLADTIRRQTHVMIEKNPVTAKPAVLQPGDGRVLYVVEFMPAPIAPAGPQIVGPRH